MPESETAPEITPLAELQQACADILPGCDWLIGMLGRRAVAYTEHIYGGRIVIDESHRWLARFPGRPDFCGETAVSCVLWIREQIVQEQAILQRWTKPPTDTAVQRAVSAADLLDENSRLRGRIEQGIKTAERWQQKDAPKGFRTAAGDEPISAPDWKMGAYSAALAVQLALEGP